MRKVSILAVGCLLGVFGVSASAETWEYGENIDLMTDEDKSTALVANGRNEVIVIRCDGTDRFELYVGVGEYLGGDRQPVSYRFDSEDPVSAGRWGLSTDKTVAFAPSSLKDELIELFRRHNQVVFQIRDYQGSSPTTKFSLEGSEAAISQMNCID